MLTLLAVLLAIDLGSGFAAAGAEVIDRGPDEMAVALSVTITDGGGPVVAHVFVGSEESVHPLTDQGGNTWATVVTGRPGYWTVAFEDVGRRLVSAPVGLADLGVDLTSPPTSTPVSESAPSSSPRWWWLVGAVAALLWALILWRLAPGPARPRHLRGTLSPPTSPRRASPGHRRRR